MKLNKQTDNKKAQAEAEPATTTTENTDYIQIINDQQAQIAELTNITQKTRADFENYRKHTDEDLTRARQTATEKTVAKLLPIIDVLDAAMVGVPNEIQANDWVRGIESAHKNVIKLMSELGLSKHSVKAGDVFDHNIHEAILFDDGDGETEVITEVLRPGYDYDGSLLRPAMVKVGKK
ncbi:MAG: nucleotide exchange factor GrpE [Candidatus Saccharibacteria bacterium]|nr:nucleotide exchange factor GrpE [Candidatus Saccharibacteria bacterium]